MSVTLNEERCRVCGKFFRLQTGRLPDYPVCPSCVAERSKAQGEDDSRAAEIKARDDMLQPVTPSAPCARCGHRRRCIMGASRGPEPLWPEGLDVHDGHSHNTPHPCHVIGCSCGAYVAPKEAEP